MPTQPTARTGSTPRRWPPSIRWTAIPTAWSCGTAPPPPLRTWPSRCCLSSFPLPCGRPGRTRRSASWWPPPATPARPLWMASRTCPGPRSWSSTPSTGSARCRGCKWSPSPGRTWASAPCGATSTTPRGA